jgi:hypothetical protein
MGNGSSYAHSSQGMNAAEEGERSRDLLFSNGPVALAGRPLALPGLDPDSDARRFGIWNGFELYGDDVDLVCVWLAPAPPGLPSNALGAEEGLTLTVAFNLATGILGRLADCGRGGGDPRFESSFWGP